MISLPRIRLALELLLVVACALLYAWASRSASQRAESESRTQVLEQQVKQLTETKQETEKDTRTVVHTVVKPDGTKDVTETHEHITLHETEHETEQVQTQKQVTQDVRTETQSAPNLSRYSLDLDWTPTAPWLSPYTPTSAHVGARIGDLPVWFTLGADRQSDGRIVPTLGTRIEI